MSFIPIIPAAVYTMGFVVNSLRGMDQNGSEEVQIYKKNAEIKKEQSYRSEYEAYWHGCKNGFVYSLIDSAVWPVKVGYFALYLVRKNANS